MSDITEHQGDQIDEQRKLLKIYRAASGYTIKALEDAIDDIEDAMQNAGHMSQLYDARRDELHQMLSAIQDDND